MKDTGHGRHAPEPRWFACHCCDTLHRQVGLAEGRAARCVRCGATLYQNRPASLRRASAFALAAVFLMAVVQFFPFLTMDAASLHRELTLEGTARALVESGMAVLGLGVITFTIVAPLILSCGILWVCLPLIFGKRFPGSATAVKWMALSEPWNMVEVYLLAVLVSLLKLDKVADVEFGIGFWAFCGVMLCLGGAVAAIDKEELWDCLEGARA